MGFSAGAVHVFVRSGTNWSQQAYLKPSHLDPFDYFGWSVAISGDTIVVGAKEEASNATGVNGDQSNNSATPRRGLRLCAQRNESGASRPTLKLPTPRRLTSLASRVAVSGDTVVVGASVEDSSATGRQWRPERQQRH